MTGESVTAAYTDGDLFYVGFILVSATRAVLSCLPSLFFF